MESPPAKDRRPNHWAMPLIAYKYMEEVIKTVGTTTYISGKHLDNMWQWCGSFQVLRNAWCREVGQHTMTELLGLRGPQLTAIESKAVYDFDNLVAVLMPNQHSTLLTWPMNFLRLCEISGSSSPLLRIFWPKFGQLSTTSIQWPPMNKWASSIYEWLLEEKRLGLFTMHLDLLAFKSHQIN